jgi:elongation factor G
MAAPAPENIINIAFAGHSSAGKTTLIEGLLVKAGAILRMGRVDDGTSHLDGDAEARERKHTIDPAIAFLEHNQKLLNLIDTPGYRDFQGGLYGPLSVVESLVVLVDADEGIRPHTRKIWEMAEARKLPCFVAITRLDREHAKLEETLAQVQDQLDPRCIPISYPRGIGPSLSGVELTFGEGKAAEGPAVDHGQKLTEAVVESNDAMMERYLSGEEIDPVQLDLQLRKAVRSREVYPVLFLSTLKDLGLAEALKVFSSYAPPASSDLGNHALVHGSSEKVPVPLGRDEPLCAFVFRVVSDPYVGKLTFLRFFAGSLAQNGQFVNPHTGKLEKVGKLVRAQGKDQVPIESAGAGEIAALLKVESLKTFDTVTTADRRLVIPPPQLPTPMFSRAVEPKTKTDDKKFSEALSKITDEDVSVVARRDSRTHETVVSGMSQLHLSVIWARLKSRFHVEVVTKEPKTPYLETITAKGDDHYRHKKQSGGAGEFAEVWMRVEPLERGKGYEFVNDVFGGAIAAGYVASAEKGVKAVMEKGVIAGYPVVDLKVSVYDGKEHPVDSKDVAFQKAGREAFKLAVRQAKPVLLEPIVHLEVTFPSQVMGDITGDLNRRRARVMGMDSVGLFQTIKAQIPLAELVDYAGALGSMTAGQGTYSIEPSHYEVVPGNIQQKIVEAAKAELEKDTD